MLRFQIEKWSDQQIRFLASFEQVAPDKIISSTTWIDPDRTERDGFHVITHRSGKIVDLQDCRTRSKAERFARRH